MNKRSSAIILAGVLIGAGVLAASVLVPWARPDHRLLVKCYFQNVQGLREAGEVRMAGVRVGTVTGIRVRPELHSAEVTMELRTPYELQLPADAVARVETAGVLGEPFVQIDISKTSGPPLASGGVLKSQPGQSITAKQWVECLSNLMAHKPCDLSAKTDENQEAPERK